MTTTIDEQLTRSHRIRLDTGWLFGGSVPLPGPAGRLRPAVVRAWSRMDRDTADWTPVTLPHTVAALPWRHWDPASWDKVWAYRTLVPIPELASGARVFLDFEGAMTAANVTVNDTWLGEHRGGYLPFSFEITRQVAAGTTATVSVILDSRFNVNVPPNIGEPARPDAIDYYQPGGLHRDVWLRIEPEAHLARIALQHESVLDPQGRRTVVTLTVDTDVDLPDTTAFVRLLDAAGDEVATAPTRVGDLPTGRHELRVDLTGLDDVQLWDVDHPSLYDVEAELRTAGAIRHVTRIRTGYREARWERDGFYLNGVRRYLMGVNRHGYFPYTGFAMPDRVHRRDAEIIRRDLNCTMVRCSHYPQTSSFLDACDELGLLVWEESPGWQYVGDAEWQEQAVVDITEMITRDRHRPSIVIWGARLNETGDRPDLYARTEALVKSLDPTRATSGSMHGDYSREAVFSHDVFSYDDYETVVDEDGDRRPDLRPPVTDRPYLVSEAVSSRSSPTTFYRRTDLAPVQQHQALDYAHAHDAARADERFSGLLAWVGFDYQADFGNHHNGVKCAGLGDVFRNLKPGAALYRSQIDPVERIVIEPAFTWDPPQLGQLDAYGRRPEAQRWGPGEHAVICSNCDRLEVYLGDEHVTTALPDRRRFPHLAYPPSFADLRLEGRPGHDLRIVGYLGDRLVGERRYAGDRQGDGLTLTPDDAQLQADGVDATRVVLAVVDRFGECRGAARTRVTLEVAGPGQLLGDNPFDLEATGGVGAVWVRTIAGHRGTITVRATAPGFGATATQVVADAH